MLHAIVLTDAWREAVPLLQSIQLTAKPTTSAFCVVAARAFQANEPAIGWQILHDCVAADRMPKCEVFLAYWQMCQRNVHTNPGVQIDELTKMLRFIGQHGFVVSRLVIDELANVFHTLGKSTKVVQMKDK